MRPRRSTGEYQQRDPAAQQWMSCFNEAPAIYRGIPRGPGICSRGQTASMRPRRSTGEYDSYVVLVAQLAGASMRPRRSTGEYKVLHNRADKTAKASMRPRRSTGEYGLVTIPVTRPLYPSLASGRPHQSDDGHRHGDGTLRLYHNVLIFQRVAPCEGSPALGAPLACSQSRGGPIFDVLSALQGRRFLSPPCARRFPTGWRPFSTSNTKTESVVWLHMVARSAMRCR